MQQENFSDAEVSVKQIPMMASSQGGAICKFAAYFGEVLARRMYRFRPPSDCSLLDAAFDFAFHAHFYESCPTLNSSTSPRTRPSSRLSVADAASIKQGMQCRLFSKPSLSALIEAAVGTNEEARESNPEANELELSRVSEMQLILADPSQCILLN
ncbi:hypothetical protein ZEAMMB73_Zm00001d046092 [Zea mays]|uniref:Uncharacterized protein n=1 Tax=Zea mays TaxID=4577 RepID=A0A1D6P0V6_MAIZE|nr:hypothetical protein ZEAMMB73_Zm00001d046092 [Zea mays]